MWCFLIFACLSWPSHIKWESLRVLKNWSQNFAFSSDSWSSLFQQSLVFSHLLLPRSFGVLSLCLCLLPAYSSCIPCCWIRLQRGCLGRRDVCREKVTQDYDNLSLYETNLNIPVHMCTRCRFLVSILLYTRKIHNWKYKSYSNMLFWGRKCRQNS